MYSRIIYPQIKNTNELYALGIKNNMDPGILNSFQVEKTGRIFQDFIKYLVLPRNLTREAVVDCLKGHINSFIDSLPLYEKPYEIGRFDTQKDEKEKKESEFIGNLSYSSKSNILECLSIIMHKFDPIQRHNSLMSTGNMVVVLTPGNGNFYVEEYFYNFVRINAYVNDIQFIFVNFGEARDIRHPIFNYFDDETYYQDQKKTTSKYNFNQ